VPREPVSWVSTKAYHQRLCVIAALACCGYFFLCGCLWIDAIGIHTDEALFSAGLYEPIAREYTLSVFQKRIPLMVMTYVGTLKSLIYWPVFAVWEPSAASTRVPVIAIGTLTVWLYFRLLLRTSGSRAALVGCALLATDPMFLLTTKWDWGPVAIHHFCLAAGLLLLVKYHQQSKASLLAAGFFVFGLGLWNKAIFIWPLIGLLAGGLAAFPKPVISVLRTRRAAIALTAFLIGAMPLLIYNVRRNFVTFRSNAVWSAEGLTDKAKLLKHTHEGSALLGWTVRDHSDGPLREPHSRLEIACVALSNAFGGPTRSLMGYAFGTSLLLFPLVWRSTWRPVLFSLCFLIVTWLQMAFTKGAGTGPHHSILLWPFPIFLAAVIFAAASHRWRYGTAMLAAGVTLIAAANVLVTATYYRNQIRNGGTASWTDAIYGLTETLRRIDAKQVNLVDWAYFDTIRLLHKGRIALGVATAPVSETDRAFVRSQVSNPENLFAGPAQGRGSGDGPTERFVSFAAQEGYRRRLIGVFADRNGRPMIELFQFEEMR